MKLLAAVIFLWLKSNFALQHWFYERFYKVHKARIRAHGIEIRLELFCFDFIFFWNWTCKVLADYGAHFWFFMLGEEHFFTNSFSINNGSMPCIWLQCSQWTSKVQIFDNSLKRLSCKISLSEKVVSFCPQVSILIIDPTCFSWVKGCVMKHFITYYDTHKKLFYKVSPKTMF